MRPFLEAKDDHWYGSYADGGYWKMKIETHIITWNRENTIHLTLNHYLRLGKVILYDNFSDDRTREIAESMGAEVRLFGKVGVLDDGEYLKIKNHCWKGSKADWVIVVDDDEILYHPYMMTVLKSSIELGYTIIQPQGFGMYSESMPKEDWLEIQTGKRDEKYSKLCCFNPRLTEINYVYGCHEANPKGLVNISNQMSLLHYQAVGGVKRMVDRHKLYEERRLKSSLNIRWGLGKEYGNTAESKRIWFQNGLENSVHLSEVGFPSFLETPHHSQKNG